MSVTPYFPIQIRLLENGFLVTYRGKEYCCEDIDKLQIAIEEMVVKEKESGPRRRDLENASALGCK